MSRWLTAVIRRYRIRWARRKADEMTLKALQAADIPIIAARYRDLARQLHQHADMLEASSAASPPPLRLV